MVHNDLLNRFTLRILKYAVCMFFLFSGLAIAANSCTVYNTEGTIDFVT